MSDAVGEYYDRNVGPFVAAAAGTGAIHRELWAPGVRTRAEALATAHRLIVEQVSAALAEDLTGGSADTFAVRLLDLGCGVGGTMAAVAAALPDALVGGVTLSDAQAAIARDRCPAAAVVTGDYANRADVAAAARLSPDSTGGVHAVWLVESFVHAPDPDAVIDVAASRMEPGGRLVIIDDFLAVERSEIGGRDRTLVDAFARGWHAPHLGTVDALSRRAARVGLTRIETRDLTPWIRTRTLRAIGARAGAVGARLFALRGAWADNLRGGAALTALTERRTTRYCMVAFRKTRTEPRQRY